MCAKAVHRCCLQAVYELTVLRSCDLTTRHRWCCTSMMCNKLEFAVVWSNMRVCSITGSSELPSSTDCRAIKVCFSEINLAPLTCFWFTWFIQWAWAQTTSTPRYHQSNVTVQTALHQVSCFLSHKLGEPRPSCAPYAPKPTLQDLHYATIYLEMV